MQAAGMPGHALSYRSMHACAIDVVERHGPRGLYHGLLPNMAKAVPSLALSYAVFEKVRLTNPGPRTASPLRSGTTTRTSLLRAPLPRVPGEVASQLTNV